MKLIQELLKYQELTKRTEDRTKSKEEMLVQYALGCSGEGGEVADLIKKVIFHGHELNKEELAKELGDMMWYIARMSELIGYTLPEIATMNIEKLKRRYPNGFEQERSINRQQE